MSRRHSHRWLVLLTIPLSIAACDNGSLDTNAITAPSAFVGAGSFEPSPFVGGVFVPATIPFVPLTRFGCPLVAPFTTNFSLSIDQLRGSDVFLHEVGFRFTDASGIASARRLTGNELGGMFATNLIAAGTARQFSFATPFGCGFRSSPSSLFLRLLLRDRRGGVHERTATARLG
jgi:hypothetical protein